MIIKSKKQKQTYKTNFDIFILKSLGIEICYS